MCGILVFIVVLYFLCDAKTSQDKTSWLYYPPALGSHLLIIFVTIAVMM